MNSLKTLSPHKVLLAPMVGLSHIALRRSLQEVIPSNINRLWTTEMLNSRKLPYQILEATPETLISENDVNLYPQILGNNEEHIRQSLLKLQNWGAVAVDINMGCPVKKALKHNYGVSLMGDKDYAGKVVAMATQNTTLPISVKLRAGIQKDDSFLLSFCETLIENGVSWLTLHPRLASEKRRGMADWKQIKLLKDHFDIPIIGNGDIQCKEDIECLLEETGCDAVMIGRALTAKPWLLDYNNCHIIDPHEQAITYGKLLLNHTKNCFKYFDNKNALKRIYFHIRVSHMWLNFGHSLYKGIMRRKEENELLDYISSFFDNDTLMMTKRTNLRY